ncbi:MAG TPA: LLM class flavin-dependent oxidoreductase [Rugosimonospora sp.]|nr:LLM class flavin-dependent oxidoreductase [Rugosimonospora sp.]
MTAPYPPRPDMRIGLILPTKGASTGPEALDAGAGLAVELGWHSVWVTDHLMVPAGEEADEYGTILEALTALTWVGARFPTLTLGTSVLVPAMRDAPQLAKEIATIDVLTGGRLIVGVGVSDAHDDPEYANLGKLHRFGRRGAYLDETVALWRHLWSGNIAPFVGEFNELKDFTFAPLPVQGAAIPIWCGGRSARAVRRTAELADGYHAAQTGPDDLRERIPQIARAVAITGRALPTLSVRARIKFDQDPGPVYTIAGSHEQMIAELTEFARLGVRDLIVVFDSAEPAALERAMRRFETEVVAPFRDRFDPAEGG